MAGAKLWPVRRRFLKGTVVNAWTWFSGLLGHVGSFFLLVGLFGVSTAGVVVLELPVWAAAVVIGLVLLTALGEGAFRMWRQTLEGQYRTDLTYIPVVGETFRNERVEIDGKSFSNCTFINVRMIYRGRQGYDLVNCTFRGIHIDVENNPSLVGLFVLMHHLGFLHPRLTNFHHDLTETGEVGPERPPRPGEEAPAMPTRTSGVMPATASSVATPILGVCPRTGQLVPIPFAAEPEVEATAAVISGTPAFGPCASCSGEHHFNKVAGEVRARIWDQ